MRILFTWTIFLSTTINQDKPRLDGSIPPSTFVGKFRKGYCSLSRDWGGGGDEEKSQKVGISFQCVLVFPSPHIHIFPHPSCIRQHNFPSILPPSFASLLANSRWRSYKLTSSRLPRKKEKKQLLDERIQFLVLVPPARPSVTQPET